MRSRVTRFEESPQQYRVQPRDRGPLLEFMLTALRSCGCQIIHQPTPDHAPFRITFETPSAERMGIVAYAFLANARQTRNRPPDEHRFQVKYGTKDGREHRLWQDPYGLYTTLMLGINPPQRFFVGVDPVLHNPTKFFISVEFKQERVETILKSAWHAWERDRRSAEDGVEDRAEVLVGGTAGSFLRYVQFERDALGEDQGHRQLLAERSQLVEVPSALTGTAQLVPSTRRMHELVEEFQLSETEILDLITKARRLKMAVRGWVAEEHLVRELSRVPGVTDCRRLDEEGGPDVGLRYEGSETLMIECKNTLRQRTGDGRPRIDFQRTRASKRDPSSRYYAVDDFDVLAACLHAVEERWEFPRSADKSPSCDFRRGRRPRRTARQEPRPPDRFIKHSLNSDGRAALLRRRADGASTRIRLS